MNAEGATHVLRVDNLVVRGLPPLSFTVPTGECLAVEGPSGAGKTQLLRAIADLDAARGYVFLEGAERGGDERHSLAQACALCCRRARLVGRDRPFAAPATWSALGGCWRRWVWMRRCWIGCSPLCLPASASASRWRAPWLDEPSVLLLDEPTAALDQEAAALVEELIKFQMLAGRCILLVSHDAGQIKRLAHARLLLGAKGGPDVRSGAAA